jgi:glycerate-2-kinase
MSLEDVQAVTSALLGAGATIEELNAVRKHLSGIAGGQLARAIAPARAVTLTISDVVGSRPDVIGSGPTVPDNTTYHDALNVLRTRRVTPPQSVLDHLRAGADGMVPETPKPDPWVATSHLYRVVADNRTALQAAEVAARDRGYQTLVLTTRMEGEAREIGAFVAGLADGIVRDAVPFAPPAALLLGGETTVHLHGGGLGGRNQELALAAAIALDRSPGILVTSFGTDGTDGPTDAAGGMVSGDTVARGRELGLEASDFLERNDAYHYLEATSALLRTGPTGTNVNDVVLILAQTIDAGTNVAGIAGSPR